MVAHMCTHLIHISYCYHVVTAVLVPEVWHRPELLPALINSNLAPTCPLTRNLDPRLTDMFERVPILLEDPPRQNPVMAKATPGSKRPETLCA